MVTHKKLENPMNHIVITLWSGFLKGRFFFVEGGFFVVHSVNKNLSQNEDPTFGAFFSLGIE